MLRVVIGAAAIAAAVPVWCQTDDLRYPTKPVRFIMPVPPGGGTDQLGRIVAQRISEMWGHSLVIDNRGGASGMIGHEIAAKAVPDGYSIVMGFFGPMAVNVHLFKLPYDPIRDFAPVTLLATAPNLLLVHPSLPVRSVRELIELARARPGGLNYSSGGIGSAPHLSGELFNRTMGVKTTHVPYKGAAAAVRDLMAGYVQFGFISVPSSFAQIQAGRLIPIAVAASRRAALLPDVPTVDEAGGVRDFESYQWWGVLVPARVSAAIVRRLHHDFVEALSSPEVSQKFNEAGYEKGGNSPEEFKAFILKETAKWGQVIRTSGIRAQ